MQWKTPKNTDKYAWTEHVQAKMHFYGISEQKVLGVIRNPKRIETGIVENTVAVMQPVGTIKKGAQKPKWGQPTYAPKEVSLEGNDKDKETWGQEIWVMYKLRGSEAISKSQIPISKQKEENDKTTKISNLKLKISNSANRKICIISAWRYPGMAPEHDPIPSEIMRELEEII